MPDITRRLSIQRYWPRTQAWTRNVSRTPTYREWTRRLPGALQFVRASGLNALILMLALLTYLLNTYRLQQLILDDAYITFRFARNLAAGQGFVWNLGGPPVEGFTSILHVMLIATAMRLGMQPEVASLTLAVGSVLATVAIIAIVLRRHFGPIFPATAVILGIYLIDPTTAALSTNGLETQFFVLLLAIGYVVGLAFIEAPTWANACWLSLAVFLSVLGRPEGVVYGTAMYAVLGIYVGVLLWRKDPSAVTIARRFLWSASFLALLGAGYAAWKYSYFGYLLPNSFYVKSNQVSLAGLDPVKQYIKHIVTLFVPLLLGFVVFVPGKYIKTAIRTPKAGVKVLLTLGPPLLALSYYLTIVHEVGGNYRFSYPTYFYFVVGGAAVVAMAVRSYRDKSHHRLQQLMVAGMCLIIILATHESWQVFRTPITQAPRDGFSQYHFKIANALKETGLGPRATVLNDAAGIIPFVSEFNHVDRVGLTNNFLSGRHPISPEERERYLWSQNADVYIGYEPPAASEAQTPESDMNLHSAYVNNVLLAPTFSSPIGARMFVQEPAFLYSRMKELRDNWYWVGEVEWPGRQVWKLKSFVYVRKDSPYFDVLVSSLEDIVARPPNQITLNDVE